MNKKNIKALINIATLAVILCFSLLLLGNYGLSGTMPIMEDNGINAINLVFFFGFNALFLGCLFYLMKVLKRAVNKNKTYNVKSAASH